MCGIFGVISKNPILYSHIRQPFEVLFKAAYSRGKEASGIATLSQNHHITLVKSDLDGRKFLKSSDYKNFTARTASEHLITVIGHSRLATHGTQLADENNQPVVSKKQKVIGVHNGIIANANALWSQMDGKGKPPPLDTQVVLDYFEHLCESHSVEEALAQTYSNLQGSASLALSLPHSETLLLSTNTGSLYYYHDNSSDKLFFASERTFLEEAFPALNSSSEIIHLKPLTALCITSGKKNAFSLDTKQNPGTKTFLRISSNGSLNISDLSPAEKKSLATRLYTVTNSVEALKKHDFDYERIHAIRRCVKCILPDTTPFIEFDKEGVCSYCREHKAVTYKGEDQLEAIVKKYRKGKGEPDCLAAFSGGRDSSWGLHYLKKELGMEPLAYTYDWAMVTDLARRNQARMLGKLGIEHIIVSADITVKRKHIRENILAWMKRPHLGMVPLFMEGDKQCEFHADRIMKKYNLDLMFFFRGNELEKDEFKHGTCGVKDADPGGVIHNLAPLSKVKMLAFYAGQYIKNPAYFNSSFFDTGLAYFSTYIQKHNYVFLWHYVPWKEQVIVDTLIREYNWETPTETKATWRTDDGTSAFYNYIYYQGMGFTENDSMRSRQIREGLMTREKAIELVNEENKPRYHALKWYFDMVGLNGDEVLTVVDNMKRLY